MIKNIVTAVGVVLTLAAVSSYSEARGRGGWEDQRQEQSRRNRGGYDQGDRNGGINNPGGDAPNTNGDGAIVSAANGRRNLNFVEGSGMPVTQILPDDNQGLRHQKFVVQLSNGQKMLAVYNLDMGGCDKIPLRVGDVVAMGGEFKWTNQGALLHWLHYDPSNRRPDGYVQVNGKDYCRYEPKN